MKTLKVKLFRHILMIALMIATGSAIVFAAFANLRLGSVSGSTDNVVAEIDFSSSSSGGACFDVAGNACVNLLSAPGNTYSVDVEVKNTNVNNRGMSYNLNFDLSQSDTVKYAILVYIDGVYYDTLGAITDNTTNQTPTLGYIMPNQIKTHTIRFEYHIGSNIAYNNQKVVLKLRANYRPVNKTEATLVNSFEDVLDGNDQVLKYGIQNIAKATRENNYSNAKVILTDHLVISEDLTFYTPIVLDTNGYNVTIDAGKTVSFLGEGINRIMGSGSVLGTGKIKINQANGILLSNKNGAQYEFAAFNTPLLQQSYHDYLTQAMQGGVFTSLDFAGNSYGLYNPMASVAPEFQSALLVNNTSKLLYPAPLNNSYSAAFSISATAGAASFSLFDGSVNVWGVGSQNYVNTLIDDELLYLKNTPVVGHSLFLPNRFKGATSSQITWYSSNPDIVNSRGIYSKPIVDQTIILTALIVVNSYSHVVDFPIMTVGMTYQEKVNLLIGGFGYIHFDELNHTINLPNMGNYTTYTSNTNLGITAISYTLDTDLYPFLTLPSSDQIKIIDYTALEYATVRMNVTFGSAGTFYGNIPITVSLAPPSGILDYYSIYEYIRVFFPEEDVIENFMVPTFYRTPVTYWIPDSTPGNGAAKPRDILNGVEIINSQDAINIVGSGESFVDGEVVIDSNQAPVEDTVISVIVEVGTQRRLFTFTVSGVLHTTRAYNGGMPSNVEIPSTILFDEILNDLFQNVPLGRNYVVSKALYEPYYRKSTVLTVVKTTNAQDITTLQGLEYFSFLTELSVSVNTISPTDATKSPANLQNNSFADVTYIKDLTNLTYIELKHASITTIASWTKLKKVITLDLRGNTDLMFIQSIERWSGALKNLDVRGASAINPRDEVSLHFYPFSKTADLYKAATGGSATLRYNPTGVNNGTTWGINNFFSSWAFYKNAKAGADRINGIPDVIFESLALPNFVYDGFSLNDAESYWAIDTAYSNTSQYIQITKVGNLTWKATVIARPVVDTEIIIVLNSATLGILSTLVGVRRAFFITMKGTG